MAQPVVIVEGGAICLADQWQTNVYSGANLSAQFGEARFTPLTWFKGPKY